MNRKIMLSFFVCIGLICPVNGHTRHIPVSGKMAGEKGCIIIYGDSRDNHKVHREIVSAMINLNPTTVFHTGDLVNFGGDEEEWKIFNDITKELFKKAAFYPAIGNHEYNSKRYFDNFQLPNNEQWYSVDIGNIHFIVLDTNWHIFEHSEQYEWLENDLQHINPGITFRIVVHHHLPFSSGHHAGDEKHLLDYVVPLYEKYNVDMVFCGHNHAYERLYHNNIYYIVTAGGGAKLYEKRHDIPQSQLYIKTHHFCALYVSDKQLQVIVYSKDMEVIDRFRKLKRLKK
jgi:predicted MPP superfamily phosphohydrolase